MMKKKKWWSYRVQLSSIRDRLQQWEKFSRKSAQYFDCKHRDLTLTRHKFFSAIRALLLSWREREDCHLMPKSQRQRDQHRFLLLATKTGNWKRRSEDDDDFIFFLRSFCEEFSISNFFLLLLFLTRERAWMEWHIRQKEKKVSTLGTDPAWWVRVSRVAFIALVCPIQMLCAAEINELVALNLGSDTHSCCFRGVYRNFIVEISIEHWNMRNWGLSSPIFSVCSLSLAHLMWSHGEMSIFLWEFNYPHERETSSLEFCWTKEKLQHNKNISSKAENIARAKSRMNEWNSKPKLRLRQMHRPWYRRASLERMLFGLYFFVWKIFLWCDHSTTSPESENSGNSPNWNSNNQIIKNSPESLSPHRRCSERISDDLLRLLLHPLALLPLTLIRHCASVSNCWLRSIALRSARLRSTMNLNCSGDPSYSSLLRLLWL